MINKQEFHEKISFFTPFTYDGNQNNPTVTLVQKDSKIDIKFQVGFVGLKSEYKYHLEICISPINILKNSNEEVLKNNSNELFSAVIKTNKSEDKIIGGQLAIDMENIKTNGKGIYQAKCFIFNDDESKTELHNISTFFIVK